MPNHFSLWVTAAGVIFRGVGLINKPQIVLEQKNNLNRPFRMVLCRKWIERQVLMYFQHLSLWGRAAELIFQRGVSANPKSFYRNRKNIPKFVPFVWNCRKWIEEY
ncbi:hypothetical protein AVEN_149686-1 [Araneus ventricosus]|uniref:Uncharacterized protein n=1 Tax=Araneus ventricosus TaxID=182803 RepID=A0A4Y2QHU8_ARAVE|nr:hypothetical protein AVEN_149686-1 [Araneus ventricosus]